MSYIHPIRRVFSTANVFTIELIDSAENIFERLVFSDEKDNIYKDDDYKNRHYGEADIQRILKTEGMIKSRRKVEAIIMASKVLMSKVIRTCIPSIDPETGEIKDLVDGDSREIKNPFHNLLDMVKQYLHIWESGDMPW